MQMVPLRIVPGHFRDREHLAFVRRRAVKMLALVAGLFLAACISRIVGPMGAFPAASTATVFVASALALIAGFYLFEMLRSLAIVNTSEILTVIDACDADSSGLTSATASDFISEYFATQGFLTRAQFAQMQASLGRAYAQDHDAFAAALADQ